MDNSNLSLQQNMIIQQQQAMLQQQQAIMQQQMGYNPYGGNVNPMMMMPTPPPVVEFPDFEAFFTPEMTKPKFGDTVVNFNDNALLNPSNLDSQLAVLNTLDDQTLLNTITGNLKTIVDDVTGSNSKYISLFLNTRFVQVFTRAISNIYKSSMRLDVDIKVGINKLIYNFFYSPFAKDPNLVSISELMINLGRVTNRDVTPMLIGKGLDEDTAAMIVLTRYSTDDEMVNVHRLNNLLMEYPLELMTTQTIINIYMVLFQSITPLLEGSMFNLQDTQMVINGSGNAEVAARKAEIYSRISTALLLILNDQTSENIRSALVTYSQDYNMLHAGENIRFSFRALSKDFMRINSVVAVLMHQEGIMIP